MAYKALYRAWRPAHFSEVVGQEPIIRTLAHQIESGRIAHAYLFCGSRGTGKTSTAKLFARAVNCMHPLPGAEPCGVCEACVELAKENNMDIIEIDAASNNGVDEIRTLRDRIAYPPSVGRYKVYIVDEVHMLSAGAFNALLKTLEEPPAHAIMILATTEPQKLPATILSRCQRFDFKRIPAQVIVGRLQTVLQGIGAQADDAALADIARASEGGMRDALSLLDMCLSYGGERVTGETVRDVLGATDRSFLFDFADALLRGDAGAALTLIDRAHTDGRDPAVFARGVVSHFRALMLAKMIGGEALADLLEITAEDARRYIAQAKDAGDARLMRVLSLFMGAEADMKWASQPRAALELCAARACRPEREGDDESLRDRLETLEKAVKSGVRVKPEKAEKEQKAEDAKKPAPAAKPEKSAKPGAPDPRWIAALEAIKTGSVGMYTPLTKAIFRGEADGVATIAFPRAFSMYISKFQEEKKRAVIEGALGEAFGHPLRLAVVGEEVKAPPVNQQGLMTAFDQFGRDKVVVSDDLPM